MPESQFSEVIYTILETKIPMQKPQKNIEIQTHSLDKKKTIGAPMLCG